MKYLRFGGELLETVADPIRNFATAYDSSWSFEHITVNIVVFRQ